MKIVFLCKRRYMNQDVIENQYGRLFHLPYALSKRGHSVTGICLDYHGGDEVQFTDTPVVFEGLSWYSFTAGRLGCKLPQYIGKLKKKIKQLQPGILIGGSDALHVILTQLIARITGIPYFIDLYDNFESFGLTNIPLIKASYRRSLRSANGISTVSDALKRYVESGTHCPVIAIESTIPAGKFKPMDKFLAREELSLPTHGVLIGTAGSLSADRGTDKLYQAALSIISRSEDVHLILAGPLHNNPPPKHPNIRYMGELSHDLIPHFINALDVAVICMRDTEFGKYAFPQKLYEILACKVPLVASMVGAIGDTLSAYPQILYNQEDAGELEKVIEEQFVNMCVPDIIPPVWVEQAVKLDAFYATNR